MSYSGFMAGPDAEYLDLDDYISKALIPSFVKGLETWGITPTLQEITKYENFVKSGIWSRHTSKATGTDKIPQCLPLVLKVRVDEKDIQTINILKKGDNFVTIDYMEIPYNISPTQIDTCESTPEPDKEVIIADCWERSLAYYTPEYCKKQSETSKLDEILEELKRD